MTAFLSFLLFIISSAQSLIGLTLINSFSTVLGDVGSGGLFRVAFFVFLEFALALIVTKIRDYNNYFVIFVETVISPIAVFRYILGLLFLILLKKDYSLKSDNEEALGAVVGYLFYVSLSDEASIGRIGNFFTMLFLAFPMAFIMTYCFWINFGLYEACEAIFGASLPRPNLLICLLLILFFGGGLSTIRKQDVTVTTYNANYKFENRYTNKKKSMYSSDNYLSLTDKAIDRGWRKVRGGDEEHLTVNMILTLLCSPILAFTYFIGLIFSFLSLLIGPIYSCVGSVDYDEVPLGILQRVLHFLFAFVIMPGQVIFRRQRGRSARVSRSRGSRIEMDFSSMEGMSNLLTLIGAGVGLLYLIFAQFNIMELLSFNCAPNWLFELSMSYFLTGAIGGLFADSGFFMILILVVLIVISAVLEFVLMIAGWLLAIALTIAAFLFQAAYIWLIPLALVPVTGFLYVRTFGETGTFNKVFKLVLIAFMLFCTIRYGVYTYNAMFPD